MVIDKGKYISELKSKNIEALNYIIDKYSNLIFKVAYSVLKDRELSKECLNDVYMKIWNNSDRFNREEEKFKNWICTIAKYTAIDMLRKEKKHCDNLELDNNQITCEESVENDFENSENVRIIQREINSMNKKDREIFVRRFYRCEKIKDIAIKMGLSENAVNLRILRGRKRLSESIGEEKSND